MNCAKPMSLDTPKNISRRMEEKMKIWEGYQKGINLGGWLSQCDHTKERYETFITEEDVKKISTWDIDHVRVPIDYNLVEDENGNYKESGFTYIDRIISWTEKYHLNMILDLHKTAGYSFDAGEKEEGFFESESYQERFYKLWEELAGRYGKYSHVAFELLNEVTDKEYMKTWLRVSDTCIKRIRAITPDTDILVGGYYNNSIVSVPDLAPPQDDHIVYNFHCYDPVIFTHQGAYWVAGMPSDFRIGINTTYRDLYENALKYFPGQNGIFEQIADLDAPFGEEFFTELFKEAVQVAEERNVRLYCGEHGVIDLANKEDEEKWYRYIRAAFERYHIGSAAWNYKEMDFDLSDGRFFHK